jgi:hypothetical protein
MNSREDDHPSTNDEDGPGTLLATALAAVVSAFVWALLLALGRWVHARPLEAGAATLLLLGSWLIFRALAEVDR